MSKVLSVEEVADIQVRFQEGEGAADLAGEFGVSRSTVYRVLDEDVSEVIDEDEDVDDAEAEDVDEDTDEDEDHEEDE